MAVTHPVVGEGKKYRWLQTEKGRAYIKRHNDRHGAKKMERWRAKQTPERLQQLRTESAERMRKWNATEHGKRMRRDWSLRKAYGLTLEQVEQMIALQGGKCPICERPISVFGKGHGGCAVDHDHDTGKVRAILCHSCNIGIGSFGDDVQLIERALFYLKTGELTCR